MGSAPSTCPSTTPTVYVVVPRGVVRSRSTVPSSTSADSANAGPMTMPKTTTAARMPGMARSGSVAPPAPGTSTCRCVTR